MLGAGRFIVCHGGPFDADEEVTGVTPLKSENGHLPYSLHFFNGDVEEGIGSEGIRMVWPVAISLAAPALRACARGLSSAVRLAARPV